MAPGDSVEVLPGYGLEMPTVSVCRLGPCGSTRGGQGPLSVDVAIAAYGNLRLRVLLHELAQVMPAQRVGSTSFFVYYKAWPSADTLAELAQASDGAGVRLHLSLGMPNVGRAEHTQLQHIVEQYESLADITLFVKDSVLTHTHLDASLRLLEFGRALHPDLDFWCGRVINYVPASFNQSTYRSERCWRFGECYANETLVPASVRALSRWMASNGLRPPSASGAHRGGADGKRGPRPVPSAPSSLPPADVPSIPACFSGVFAAS